MAKEIVKCWKAAATKQDEVDSISRSWGPAKKASKSQCGRTNQKYDNSSKQISIVACLRLQWKLHGMSEDRDLSGSGSNLPCSW